ncbi:MAG TPA: tetratricopeptide repeat protein [Ktedonobacterales bacterium]
MGTSLDTPDFAALLRRHRRASGLTQEELAERAGLSAASVSLLERGLTRTPQRATVEMLSAALALPPTDAAAFMEAARRVRRSDGVSSAADGVESIAPGLSSSGSLPVPLTTLIGRDHDEDALLDLLAHPTTRLLTLTGPAGVGKTRLAVHLAATLQREQGQDVAFVGLIPVQEPDRVLAAIAQALDLRAGGARPLRDSLAHALRDRKLVLVLDNFEQVLPAARAVLELLIACPHVKALVTSRAALNVRGEHCFPVAPLALPTPAEMDSVDALRAVPSVALFVERARAAQPDFAPTSLPEARLVADICARLDGLPLAIELAAARVRFLGPRQLHDRLHAPRFLGVLAEGPQDLADHQRTMRSTIAWSYDQLTEEQRRLFRSLGVFVGGAAADAIERVSGLTDEALLADLGALLDASLLQCANSTDCADTPRFTQLVTLRAYAQECLRAAGEWEEARRRHAEFFLEMVELIDTQVLDQVEGLMARLEVEYENVRAALSWALEADATSHGLRMVAPLWRFWAFHHFQDGLKWLQRFITMAGTSTSREELYLLAEAWTGVLAILHRQDRLEQAREAGEKALALRRALGDKTQIAHAMSNLANPLTALGEYEQAAALFEACLALHRETGNRRGMVFPLLNLGGLHYEMGKPREALASYEESLALSCELGESDWARALTWNNVGEAYVVLDEPARAVEVTEPSYRLFLREHDIFGVATCAITLGRAHWRLGDFAAARAELDDAEQLFRSLGNQTMAARIRYIRASLALEAGDSETARADLVQALDDLSGQTREGEYIWWLVERAAALACRRGALERAAQLYAAALAHRDATPMPLDPAERALRARDLACLLAVLGNDARESAFAAGRALSRDDAIALMRHELG